MQHTNFSTRLYRIYRDVVIEEISEIISQDMPRPTRRKPNVSLSFFWIMKGIYAMRKGKSDASSKQTSGHFSGTIQWVNRNLSQEEREEFQNYALSDREVLLAIFELGERGYTLTVKPPRGDGSGFNAFLLGSSNDCENVGKGLSAYASDVGTAIQVLLFKHYVLFGNGRWPEQSPANKSNFG